MAQNRAESIDRFIVLPLGIVLVELAVQPGAMDPLGPIKFWVLGLMALWFFSIIATSRSLLKTILTKRPLRNLSLFLGAFLVFFLVSALHTSVKTVAFLGETRRDLGFLNYLFLAFLMVYAALKISMSNVTQIYWTVAALCFFFTLYGVFQHFHKDLFHWSNQYNSIILTTGNPDFASSLLGLLVVIASAWILIISSKSSRIFGSCLVLVTVLVIYWSQARQGLIAVAAGLGFLFVVLLRQKSKKLSYYLLGAEFFVGVASVLGMLQIGPLTRYFYKASINDRGYNWRAAISIFKHHPFFGVGPDRYGAYFLQYRDAKYPLIYGYTQTVTNAHNIYLENFATLGLFAGLAYIFLTIFVGYRAFVGMKMTSGKSQIMLAGIVAGWIVFVAQSLISVDTLVISIWGWLLGGAIVGLSINANPAITIAIKKIGPQKKERISNATLLWIVGVIGFTLIVIPMHRNESKTQNFVGLSSPTNQAERDLYRKLASKIIDQPLLSSDYINEIATKLAQNNFGPEALRGFAKAIKVDPRNSTSYSLISLVYENLKRPEDAITYRKELARLDPYGAENLLALEADYLKTGNIRLAAQVRDSILAMAPKASVAQEAEKLISK